MGFCFFRCVQQITSKYESIAYYAFRIILWNNLYLPFFSWNISAINFTPFIWLALGSNLILYFILKAWESCDISAIQPIKYIEFPIAIYFGKVMFQETPSIYIFIGLAVLVFGLILNAKREISK
jgi:uncharacterized membrane protein